MFPPLMLLVIFLLGTGGYSVWFFSLDGIKLKWYHFFFPPSAIIAAVFSLIVLFWLLDRLKPRVRVQGRETRPLS